MIIAETIQSTGSFRMETTALADRNVPTAWLWASVILVGLMCSLPLVQPRHTNPITSFYSEWVAFVLGAAALFPLALRRYSSPLCVPVVTLAPLLLAGLLVVHVLVMRLPYPQQAVLAIAYLLWSAALVMLAALLRREFGLERLAALLAWFVLAGGMLNALAGVLQHYEWRGALESVIATKLSYQVYGNLGQPNHFATHVVLSLVCLTFLYATQRLSLTWTVAATSLLLFVLALSGSRSAWLYLIAVGVLSAVAYRATRSIETRRGMALAVAVLPAFGAMQFIAGLPWLVPATLHTTTLDRMFALAGTTSERLQLWRGAWAMFLDHPIAGVGWGQFAWHNFMSVGTSGGTRLTGLYNHAHNLFMHMLAETGAVGVAIVAAALILWARGAWPLLRSPAGVWIWGCAAVLGVHSMLEYPLWNAYFLAIACVLAGIGATRDMELHQSRLVRLGVVLFVAGTAWLSSVLIDRYYRLESVVYATYRTSDRRALDRAHGEMMAVGRSFFLSPYVDVAYARDIALDTKDIDRKLAFTARVMRFAPTGMVAYRHAALLALSGDEANAHAVLVHAAAAYPTLLDDFIREFEKAETGNPAAHARFMAQLRAAASERRGTNAHPSR